MFSPHRKSPAGIGNLGGRTGQDAGVEPVASQGLREDGGNRERKGWRERHRSGLRMDALPICQGEM